MQKPSRGEMFSWDTLQRNLFICSFGFSFRYLGKGRYSLVIVDALDQPHVFKTHLELVGIDTSMIDNADVIKFGGVLKTGNVIGRIDLEGIYLSGKNTMMIF